MDNLQVRQQEINNQVTMTFLAANNENPLDMITPSHKRNRSQDSLNKILSPVVNKVSLVNSLYSLSKASGIKISNLIIGE